MKSNCKVMEILVVAAQHGVKIDGDYLEFNASTPNFQLTENFKLHEFLTKDRSNTFTRVNANIISELQQLRDTFGSGVAISSSYRSPAYNRSQNGATSSQHILGNALDTYPVNRDISGWKKVVRENKKSGGIGYYRSFVHIDTGKTRTWNG